MNERLPDLLPARRRPLLAPAWVALLSAWLGLLMMVAAAVLPFLPGSHNPRFEIEHLLPYSPADKYLVIVVYLSPLSLFVQIAVLWQMRKEPRPLDAALTAQRLQACVGILLSLAGTIFLYVWVAAHRA